MLEPSAGQFRAFWLSIALIALGGITFWVRTTQQPQYTPLDFAVVWTSSRVWLAGENPYARADAMRHWCDAGGSEGIVLKDAQADETGWLPILGIPPILAALAPMALLPAPHAVVAWYLLAAILLLAQTAALAALTGSAAYRPVGLMIFAATLAFAPLHECFGWGQPTGPAASLMILAAWGAGCRRDALAGILLGLATALKPQLGGILFLYYLLQGRWRIAWFFGLSFGILTVVALAQMELHQVPWLSGWLENLRFGELPGGVNSPSVENTRRFHLVNLQLILMPFFHSRLWSNVLAMGITAMLAMLFVRVRARRVREDELLSLSAVCVLTLLPVYHRFYDAVLMLVPLAWGIANLRQRPRLAWPVLLFAGSFLLPSPAIARAAQFLGFDPITASGLVWDALVEPGRTWILLAGFALILTAMADPATERVASADQTVMERRSCGHRTAVRGTSLISWSLPPSSVGRHPAE